MSAPLYSIPGSSAGAPTASASATAADVAKAARTYLTARNSVTGKLVRPSEAKDR